MKKQIITSINSTFNSTNDFTLQRLAVTEWKLERSISGIARYIVKNFDSSKPLKELLLRKGYKKADFGTVSEPSFSFLLSHMSDKAKYQLSFIKGAEGAKGTFTFKLDSDGNKIARTTYQLSTILTELRKIENQTV